MPSTQPQQPSQGLLLEHQVVHQNPSSHLSISYYEENEKHLYIITCASSRSDKLVKCSFDLRIRLSVVFAISCLQKTETKPHIKRNNTEVTFSAILIITTEDKRNGKNKFWSSYKFTICFISAAIYRACGNKSSFGVWWWGRCSTQNCIWVWKLSSSRQNKTNIATSLGQWKQGPCGLHDTFQVPLRWYFCINLDSIWWLQSLMEKQVKAF